jgi:hypothetical protein
MKYKNVTLGQIVWLVERNLATDYTDCHRLIVVHSCRGLIEGLWQARSANHSLFKSPTIDLSSFASLCED